MKKLIRSKNFYLLIFADIILLGISYYVSYACRFEGNIPENHFIFFRQTLLPIIFLKLIVFYYFNLYRGMWRYTSITDLSNVVKSIITSFFIIIAVILFFNRFESVSRSIFIIDALLSFIFIAGARISIRIFYASTMKENLPIFKKTRETIKLLILGAGNAGEKVAREVIDNPKLGYEIIGFLDDDHQKHGKSIHGFRILGGIHDLPNILEYQPVDEILIAIPSAKGNEIRRIVDICSKSNLQFKMLPGLSELIDGKVSLKRIRNISYSDLLGRRPVRIENEKVSELIQNKVLLITGAGGSIGSELCRQASKYEPSQLILLDVSEENLYTIQMQLEHIIGYKNYKSILGRVQDKTLVDDVLKNYQPDIIFHAAAYKHVPLMEMNPWEAVFSNILGTYILAKAAVDKGVDRFVLVSSDKAVNPTNVMGASKRVAEKIIFSLHSTSPTKFMAVRFGNVIGSSGSVMPLFQTQIESGGPVTVTHPEVTRYFMTIDESVQLILQAFAMGNGGEIFILEMGTPLKIVDIANDMIRLSGKEPADIEIIFIGLRPGEKLYEELITEGEGIVKTIHEKIYVLQNKPCICNKTTNDGTKLDVIINNLVEFAITHNTKQIKYKLKEIVPEYTISNNESVF